MKRIKIIAVSIFVLGLSSSVLAQDGGIKFKEYEYRTECNKDLLDELEMPVAITDCENQDIKLDIVDRLFSGGEHGTIERTYIASDSCGNEAKTVQYILLK